MEHIWIWIISGLSILCMLTRPFNTPEWPWTVAGALLLCACGFVDFGHTLTALGRGVDVYLFLIGMMLLSELLREEGVFAWVADQTARRAHGSAPKLFLLLYGVSCVVTIFMSNDATAVVLTPAVYQAVKKANATPRPYLFACAMIANAASFVFPISNPANLVVYGQNMPPLLEWLRFFILPSVVSIGVTFFVMKLWFRRDLRGALKRDHHKPAELSRNGRIALGGLGLTSAALLTASFFRLDLGAPAFAAAVLIAAVVSGLKREWPVVTLKNISWGVVPLVAGLFVIVEALNGAKVLDWTKDFFTHGAAMPGTLGKQIVGMTVAVVSNLANNLPVGLTSGLAVGQLQLPEQMKRAILIGIDLGPNLSVTGSLATILWLVAIRREGERVSAFDFFVLGLILMPFSLIASIAVA